MDDHPVHTIPNHHSTKMDVLPKTLIQIRLAAKWQGRAFKYTSPKQQRRPWPALLSLSFFYGKNYSIPVEHHIQRELSHFSKVSQYNAKDQDKTWTAVGTRKSKTCFRNRVFDKYFSFSFQLEKSTASEKGLIKSTPDSRSSGPGFEFVILLCEKT